MITAFVGQLQYIHQLNSQLPMSDKGRCDLIKDIELRHTITSSEKSDRKVKSLCSLFDKNLKEKKTALSVANETINKDESAKTLDNAACMEYDKWTGANHSCEVKLENMGEMLSCISRCLEHFKIPELEQPKMFDTNWWMETNSRLVSRFNLLSYFNY